MLIITFFKDALNSLEKKNAHICFDKYLSNHFNHNSVSFFTSFQHEKLQTAG